MSTGVRHGVCRMLYLVHYNMHIFCFTGIAMTNYLSTHDVRKPTLLIAKVVQRNKRRSERHETFEQNKTTSLSFHGSDNNMQFNVAIF